MTRSSLTMRGLAMENPSQDRISNLPDPILEAIMTLMPLKFAVRTSILSTRWCRLWIHNLLTSTSLDFTDEFSRRQSPNSLAATVDRYLQLYNRDTLQRFSLLFVPFDMFLPNIHRWVEFALSKKVNELELDLSQGYVDPSHPGFNDGRCLFKLPDSLYCCDSLTKLSLSRCQLANPLDFSHLACLQSLSLSFVNITDDMLHSLLKDCVILKSLSLRNCEELVEAEIVAPELERLVIGDCWGSYRLQLSTPKLKSFHYFGNIFFHNYFNDVPLLVDASICSIGRSCVVDRNYLEMLDQVLHVRVLTLCTATLTHVAIAEESNQLTELQEMQLLIDSMTDEHLTCIYSFFRLCPSPFLEKLFIELPRHLEDVIDITYAVNVDLKPPDVAFTNLKAIKVGNFKGSINEMRLVKFLLEKAVILESLVLVAPQMERRQISLASHSGTNEERIGSRILRGQLSLLPKSSQQAEIVLCQFTDDNDSLSPTHKDLYYDYSYMSEASGYTFQSSFNQFL